ncbi:MAG TPA: WecB/TagA/CpsF family glycosyltransferase [Candidatus Tyrphobacter sp.]
MISVLGCRVDDVGAPEAASRILTLAPGNAAAQVVTLGTEMVVYAQRHPRFREIVNASALSLCDTVGVLWVARRRGAHLRERVAGVELIERLCEGAAHEGLGLYLLGGKEGVAAEAAERLRRRHPGLVVAGTHHGYFDDASGAQIAAQIRASGARLLLCGLGFPRQEYWLAQHLRETGCGAGLGVGGSFDVISGRVERAPAAWRRFGLEWLYRLVKEPHRWRRQLALPAFVGLVVGDALGLRGAKGLDS